MDSEAFKYIAIAAMSIGMLGAALGVANIFSSLLNSIARNPSAEAKMARYAIIGAGMAEAIGIFALSVAMILIFK
jgi:F-type H+-transporting ATPase subunit c